MKVLATVHRSCPESIISGRRWLVVSAMHPSLLTLRYSWSQHYQLGIPWIFTTYNSRSNFSGKYLLW